MSDFKDWAEEKTEANDLASVQAELSKLRRSLESERRKRKKLEGALIHSDERLRTIIDLQEAAKKAPEFTIKTREKATVPEGTVVLMASDWHVEEVVDPETVNGVNEYNPAIARKRAEEYFLAARWWTRFYSKGFAIPEIVLWIGGDIISGYIHDELMESNELSPTEAVLLALELFKEGISKLLRWFPKTHITVVCNYGNHGRTTTKRRHSTGAKNSYEWLMYQQLKLLFSENDRVRFQIAGGAHTYLQIYDWTVRFHHGDDVRYSGGVGGLSIPLMKAVDKWDSVRHADHTIIGHYHQLKDFDHAIVNGSLVGYGAFSLAVKAKYEPPRQGFVFFDRDRGKRGVIPLYVDPNHRGADTIVRRAGA